MGKTSGNQLLHHRDAKVTAVAMSLANFGISFPSESANTKISNSSEAVELHNPGCEFSVRSPPPYLR